MDWMWLAGSGIAVYAVLVAGLEWSAGRRQGRERRTASVVHRRSSDGHGVQLTCHRLLPDAGALGITILNEGPAIAREVQVRARFAAGQARASGVRATIGPREAVTFRIDLAPAGFLAAGETPVRLTYAWRDDAGPHAAPVALRMVGVWPGGPRLVRDRTPKPPWRARG